MTSTKEWYKRVNAVWPETIPTPTEHQAVVAARKLWRWAMGETWQGKVEVTSGNRYTWVKGGVLMVNPNRPGSDGGGWKALVHDLSHLCWRKANAVEGVRPHEKGHARLELNMRKQVLKRGWLEVQPPVVEAPPPSKKDAQLDRYERIKARIESWEAKERRVKAALKKLHRQGAYYEKALAA